MATMASEANAWIQELRAGDQVVVSGGWRHNAGRIVTVDKVTPTQIVCGRDRYRKKDGKEIGSGGSFGASYWLREATPERLEAIHRFEFAQRLTLIPQEEWDLLPSFELGDLYGKIQDARKAKKAADESA